MPENKTPTAQTRTSAWLPIRKASKWLKLAGAGVAILSTVCCSSEGRGEATSAEAASENTVAFLGCVDTGDQSGQLLLWTIDDPQALGGAPRALSSGQSTATNGPWVGTRQLELVGELAGRIADHRGQRVLVSGVIEGQAQTTGPVDQVQNAQGSGFRRLRASTFEPVGGECSFDPRRREPLPPGNPDIK